MNRCIAMAKVSIQLLLFVLLCIKFSYTAPVNIKTHTKFAHEGMKMTLACKADERIEVQFGIYGIFPDEIGCDFIEKRSTYCFKTITSQVLKMCDSKSSCDVVVSSTNFGDPCPRKYKRADVNYRCMKRG